MQSSRHDSGLAALHASTALPGQIVDVIVLTADAGLLATVREASDSEHALWHAASADAAVDLLVGGRCGILVADLGTLRGDAAALLDRLHAQFPELILLATGRREDEGAVASLVSSGRIYRYLHKPISPARARVFLSAATRRSQESIDAEPMSLRTVKTIARRPGINKLVLGAGAAGLVLVLVISVLIVQFAREELIETPLSQPVAQGLTPEQQIATYLGGAQIAMATDRLVEPRRDNALEYFRAVLALKPDHAEARAGIARIVATLELRLTSALQARNAPAGLAALRALQQAQPDHPRLAALRAELLSISRGARAPAMASAPVVAATANPEPLAADSTPAANDTATTAAKAAKTPVKATAETSASAVGNSREQADLETIVSLRERGALIAPASANAFDALLAVREQHPDSDAVRAEQQRLVFALLERARTALAAQDLDTAATYLSRADTLVPGMAVAHTLQQQLAAARERREFMTNPVAAASLKRVREIAANYPREAQSKGTEGWVDVDFTIAPDGTTQDLVVKNAEPANVFNRAALDSVRRWRFEPQLIGDEAVPRRATLRVRFVLK